MASPDDKTQALAIALIPDGADLIWYVTKMGDVTDEGRISVCLTQIPHKFHSFSDCVSQLIINLPTVGIPATYASSLQPVGVRNLHHSDPFMRCLDDSRWLYRQSAGALGTSREINTYSVPRPS